jgi:cell division protein FtsB
MSRRRAARRRRRVARIRWDRIGRTGLLIVLVVVAGLYIQQAVDYFSVRSAVNQQRATVTRLARENAALQRQQQSLQNPVTIKRDARELGMIQAGERPYVVVGLHGH